MRPRRRSRPRRQEQRPELGHPQRLLQETGNGAALHGAIIASQTARDILRAASTTFRRPSSFAPKSFARRTRTYSRPSGRRTTAASCWTDEVEPVLWPTTAPDCGWRPAGISSLKVWPVRISHAFALAAPVSFARPHRGLHHGRHSRRVGFVVEALVESFRILDAAPHLHGGRAERVRERLDVFRADEREDDIGGEVGGTDDHLRDEEFERRPPSEVFRRRPVALLEADREWRAVGEALELVLHRDLVRERERPRVHAAQDFEEYGRLHRGSGVHGERGILGKSLAGRQILDVDTETRPARGRDLPKCGLEDARFHCVEPRPPSHIQRALRFIRRRNLESPGIPKERLQKRTVKGRDLHAGHAVSRGLQDHAVSEPHRFVVDLVLRAEEQEIARKERAERDRDELRVLERLLVGVPLQHDTVLAEDPLHEPRAIEPEGRRAAPGVRRAEEAAAEGDPEGGRPERKRRRRRTIFFEGEE